MKQILRFVQDDSAAELPLYGGDLAQRRWAAGAGRLPVPLRDFFSLSACSVFVYTKPCLAQLGGACHSVVVVDFLIIADVT